MPQILNNVSTPPFKLVQLKKTEVPSTQRYKGQLREHKRNEQQRGHLLATDDSLAGSCAIVTFGLSWQTTLTVAANRTRPSTNRESGPSVLSPGLNCNYFCARKHAVWVGVPSACIHTSRIHSHLLKRVTPLAGNDSSKQLRGRQLEEERKEAARLIDWFWLFMTKSIANFISGRNVSREFTSQGLIHRLCCTSLIWEED